MHILLYYIYTYMRLILQYQLTVFDATNGKIPPTLYGMQPFSAAFCALPQPCKHKELTSQENEQGKNCGSSYSVSFEILYNIQYMIRHREMLEIVFYILFPHSAQSKLILDGN